MPADRWHAITYRDIQDKRKNPRTEGPLVPVTRIEVHRGGVPPRLALIGLLGLIDLFEVLL